MLEKLDWFKTDLKGSTLKNNTIQARPYQYPYMHQMHVIVSAEHL